MKLDKRDVGWDLVELEQAAHLVLEEESQIKKEETPTDMPLEELTSNFDKLNLSQGPVAAADGVTERTNLSTETDSTLPQSVQGAEVERRDSKLPTIKLHSSVPPMAISSDKPLIEEIAEKPAGTSSEGSSCSSSESESTVSSSDEDSHSTGSSGTTKLSGSTGET